MSTTPAKRADHPDFTLPLQGNWRGPCTRQGCNLLAEEHPTPRQAAEAHHAATGHTMKWISCFTAACARCSWAWPELADPDG